MQQKQWQFALIAMFVISVLYYMGKPSNTEYSVRPAEEDVVVFEGAQGADGITQDDMDLRFLKNLEQYSRERLSQHVAQSFNSRGIPNISTDLTSEAVYAVINDVKLAVIRLNTDELYAVEVVSIIGPELRRVVCVHASPERIPVTSGSCGDRVKQVFGIELNPAT